MPDFRETDGETVYFSGKQAEEIGFEKFHARQAKLRGIHVLVLDRMQIRNRSSNLKHDETIKQICSEITELDLSNNLFEKFEEVAKLCALLPKLRTLTLDGNRMEYNCSTSLQSVTTLNLTNTLVQITELNALLGYFSALRHLSLRSNEYDQPLRLQLPPRLMTLDLSGNHFNYLSDVEAVMSHHPILKALILRHNKIAAVSTDSGSTTSSPIEELDVSYNAVSSFAFVDSLKPAKFSALRHLRLTGNPLYQNLMSADGKPLTASDGHMLTIARLPQLESLNYSKITEKERLNAETYYLGQIAAELANSSEDREPEVISRHWRYHELCEEYGEPIVSRKEKKDAINPNSLAARLIAITFTCTDEIVSGPDQRSWVEEVPKSFSIYAILGLVGKRLGQRPLDLRLVLETTEHDPAGSRDNYNGPAWWDSSDEEADHVALQDWTKREIELAASTRALATYVDGREAHVRVELKHQKT